MTNEQIAKEAAERLTAIANNRWGNPEFSIGGEEIDTCFPANANGVERLERRLLVLRPILAASHLAAIEAALLQSPVPSSIGEERLAEIREADAQCQVTQKDRPVVAMLSGPRDRHDLLAEIDHLRAMMRSPEGEAIAAAYEAGKEAGRLRGREEGIEACAPLTERHNLECEWCHCLKMTRAHAIHSNAHPEPQPRRLCDSCASACAGG